MTTRVTRGAAARLAASRGDTTAENTLDALPRRTSKPTSPPKAHVKNESPSKVPGKRPRDIDALPHGLGDIPPLSEVPVKKARKTTTKPAIKKDPKIKNEPPEDTSETKSIPPSPTTKNTKSKSASTITLNTTPYPFFPRPTPSECHRAVALLSSLHGAVRVPAAIPRASLTLAGCGEAPSVLDALLRTLISQNVTTHNASLALSGLVQRFGTIKTGFGKGSIDYNKIRKAPLEELVEAIRRLGCQEQKARQIKRILDMVWAENLKRRDGLKKEGEREGEGGDGDGVSGAANESVEGKKGEIAKVDEGVLSLDHLHLLPTQEAFSTLLAYPGIGVKTAACVCLFCLRRPVFAIDTHCYRLAQWLGWLPTAAEVKEAAAVAGATGKKVRVPALTRDTAFAHLDARVPDELKYALHKLLIVHGKTCPRCRAITSSRGKGWEEGCVIEDLVQRTGARKAQISG